MLISLIKKDRIQTISLPNKFYGVYWVTDINENGETNNLVSISSDNGKWKLNSNSDVAIMNRNVEVENLILEEYCFYAIKNKSDNSINILYCAPTYDKTFEIYSLNNQEVTIGNYNCDITISENIGNVNACIKYDSSFNFSIVDNQSKSGIFVNSKRILNECKLNIGDRVFINGIILIPIKENNNPFLLVNNPKNNVKFNLVKLTKILQQKNDAKFDDISDDDVIVFDERDYFHKKPRFKEIPEILNISIDAPPTKQSKSDMPVILTVGPMLTSSAITIIYTYISINNLIQNRQSFFTAWPSFMIAILSLMATLFWPLIIRKYTNYKYKKTEKIRKIKYNEYIKNIIKTIQENAASQERILIDNNPSCDTCKKAITEKNVNFWNRRPDDEDFLTVSVGSGELPLNINLKIPEIHFSLEKDELMDNLLLLKNDLPILKNVPILYNFGQKKVTAVIGNNHLNQTFAENILFQLTTFHSYDDLKIVVLTNEVNDKNNVWSYAKILPHCWSLDNKIRFYGSNKDEIREICYYLDNILNNRLNNHENKKKNDIPYYFIVTDNYKVVRNFEFIKKINSLDEFCGFGLLILNDKVFNLPAECDSFINLSEQNSEIFQNVLNSQVQKFRFDHNNIIEFDKYAKIMANIPIDINDEDDNSLVDKIGFLELFDVGKIEQLNILNRWKESNPMISLQTLVGIGKGGEKIYLDLHERYHGPHGLIAGMTGSGKSEFIATYILSLAINYHPYEVQFILIDYKGGGLAGIFENKMTGVKLPHLIGTITNLDENEIARSLASIESEIKRRQIIFSNVREKLGDSVVDIYKYQQLYRNGTVEIPISHLFIICDEFAELKSQQPEFLQQLISISRIGRSLGIHLILATQKPSGVVDNQIWSNSKFRICLRVQEKGDSSEVIKCPDAAFLKNVGRFYLQVGYNEVFVLGQAAWAGGKYTPSEKVKKKVDSSVEFINNIGYVIKKVDTNIKYTNNINYGEEIKNIISHLCDLSLEERIVNKNLWLDKLPEYINISDLKRKYNFIKEPFLLNVPVGEYDIPTRQKQELLTIPFYREGNVLVYGSAGSGKENFITTMIYSMVTAYTPYEVITYVLDFGTESLRVFNDIPHVGDVISADNFEKINNLFKMLFSMLNERKKLFADYNGDYNTYCKNSENKIPSVIVVINNYDSYVENFSGFDEWLIQLTREGVKFGIYFVITIVNPNVMRMKLSQNFKQIFVLQQNNISDYSNILGNVEKKYPSKIFGRGIVKLDSVYEFQTAMVSKFDKIFSYIEEVKPILNNNDVKAIEVPTLPEIVTKDSIISQLNKDGNVVIGIAKDDLDIIKYELKNYYTNLFLSYDIYMMKTFLMAFINQIKYTDYYNIIVLDAENMNIDSSNVAYYTQNFNDIFNDLYNYIIENHQIYIESGVRHSSQEKPILCIIIGFDSFKNKLNFENQSNVSEFFEKGKDLELINYIFVDSIDKIRKYEFESWYKTVVNNSRGIFVGNGISDQMIIKILRNDSKFRADIGQSFCYVVSHGKPILTKYVESFELED